jgi:hypothetical protein
MPAWAVGRAIRRCSISIPISTLKHDRRSGQFEPRPKWVGDITILDWSKCEDCDEVAMLGKTGTYKGSDEVCSAGDRIELARFLSTLIH